MKTISWLLDSQYTYVSDMSHILILDKDDGWIFK